MIKPTFLFAFALFCLMACKTTKDYSDICAPLRTDNIQKITIEIRAETTKFFTITGKQEMQDFITDLNNSGVNGPWKGAQWDKIVLLYDDGEKVFSTNGKVFGQGSSGTFYDLNTKYKHYWKN